MQSEWANVGSGGWFDQEPSWVKGGTAAPAGQWWVGADGNVWTSTNGKVENRGRYIKGDGRGFDASLFSSDRYERINDPNPPAAVNKNNVYNNGGGGGGGGGGVQYIDTSSERQATLDSIGSIDKILSGQLSSNDTDYANLIGRYDTEDAQNLQRYNDEVDSNEGQRDISTQAGLQGAAVGRRGLYSTLAAIGALGGTGDLLADRAVSMEANRDLGESNRTFDANAKTLFDSREAMKDEEEQRRLDAKKTRDDRAMAYKYDAASSKQGLYKTLSDLWADAGNNKEKAGALAKASSFNPQLIANSKPAVKEYATKALNWAKPALSKYLAGKNDMSVQVAGGDRPVNGALYTSTKKREEV